MITEQNTIEWGPSDFPKEIVEHSEPDFVTNPFPFEIVSKDLQCFAREVHRVTGAPLELVVGTCHSVISAAIALGAQIRNAYKGNNGLAILQHIFALESGSGKSTLLNLVRKPFDVWQAEKEQHFTASELPKLLVEREILQQELKFKTKSTKEDREVDFEDARRIQEKLSDLERQLSQPQYTTEDCTLSAMAHLLAQNGKTGQEAVFGVSPDARPAIRTIMGAWNKKGNVEDSILVKGYSGDPHQQDRRGQNGTCRIHKACVNLLFFIQPDVLREILANTEMMHSGFIQRVMFSEIVWPISHYSHPAPIAEGPQKWWDDTINRILKTYRVMETPVFFEYEGKARELIISYHDQIVDEIKSGVYSDIQSHAVRWHEWAARLALVSAILRREKDEPNLVDEKDAEVGVALAKYYAGEKLVLLDQSRELEKSELRQKLSNLLKESSAGLTRREIQRKLHHPSAKAIENALEMIPEVKSVSYEQPGGGWVTTRYFWAHRN
jgi:hypothetical protein